MRITLDYLLAKNEVGFTSATDVYVKHGIYGQVTVYTAFHQMRNCYSDVYYSIGSVGEYTLDYI